MDKRQFAFLRIQEPEMDEVDVEEWPESPGGLLRKESAAPLFEIL